MFPKPDFPTKKTFYHDFFLTKEEEEEEASRGLKRGSPHRTLVEIQDIYPPPVVDPDNAWPIKKTLTRDEIRFGKLIVSWNDTFEHVLRYWLLELANDVCVGLRVDVTLWDVTKEDLPKEYDAYLQIGGEEDEFHLTCMSLMCNRNLQVDDQVLLHWDFDQACFKYKLLL